jgi:hypothetical protein
LSGIGREAELVPVIEPGPKRTQAGEDTRTEAHVKGIGFLVIVGLVAAVGLTRSADGAEGTLKGYMFGDYYYVASGADEKENGFKFRRIYFTYNVKWDDAFSGRFRLEAKDAGFGNTSKMEPFVKHAYLRYKRSGKSVYAGMSGTPTWNVSERLWGYRSIMATIMDVNKLGSSADLGVALHGNVDAGGKLNFQLMLGNGPGQKPEVDNGKKLYGLLHFKPAGTVEATLYLDWDGHPDGRDGITVAGFIGAAGERFHGGLEGFQRTNRKQSAGEDVQVRGLSAFGSGKVGQNTKAFGRIDLYDPSDLDDDNREYLFIGGIDVEPTKGVHLMPNILVTAFQDGNQDTEVVPRMTVFYKF